MARNFCVAGSLSCNYRERQGAAHAAFSRFLSVAVCARQNGYSICHGGFNQAPRILASPSGTQLEFAARREKRESSVTEALSSGTKIPHPMTVALSD